ncbi:MAG: hypothetical protein ACEPOV_04075 [Hyphomicrobiales bacterium]
MKFKLLLFLFLITTFKSFAQENDIPTEVYLDDPSKLSKHTLMISPLSTRLRLPLILDIGFEVKGYTELSNKFALEGLVAFPYAKINKINESTSSPLFYSHLPEIEDKVNSSFDFEIGGLLVFSEVIGTKNYAFSIEKYHTYDGYGVYENYYQNAKIRKRIKLRFGYKRYSGFSYLLDPFSESYFTTNRGGRFYNNYIAFHSPSPSPFNPFSDSEIDVSKSWVANSSTNMFYLGIEFDRSFNIILRNKELGLKKFRYTTRYYADVIIGSTKLDDFKFYMIGSDNSGPTLLPNIVDYKPIIGHGLKDNKFGFRIGYEFYQNAPTLFGKYFDKDVLKTGLQYGAKAEAGILPGINSGLYGAITLYLAFNK